jgi:hypothetical protein
LRISYQVDDGLTFHGLRASCGTALAEIGCSAHQIMSILGHKTLAMAQKYTEQARRKRLAMKAMARRAGEAPPPRDEDEEGRTAREPVSKPAGNFWKLGQRSLPSFQTQAADFVEEKLGWGTRIRT